MNIILKSYIFYVSIMSWLILTNLSDSNVKLKNDIYLLKNFILLYAKKNREKQLFLQRNFDQMYEVVNIS